jgi:hypothetical protein
MLSPIYAINITLSLVSIALGMTILDHERSRLFFWFTEPSFVFLFFSRPAYCNYHAGIVLSIIRERGKGGKIIHN